MSKSKFNTCIYCKLKKSKDIPFNSEHVVPKAFGKYGTCTPTIEICVQCNQRFGNTIDLCLSRDSYEGQLMRSKFGLIKEFDSKKHCRKISISAENKHLEDKKLNITYADNSRIVMENKSGQIFEFANGKYYSKDYDGEYLDLKIEGQMPKECFRSIAKVAFNYMTYHYGEEFALQECFDPIRDFITNEEKILKDFVITIIEEPIMYETNKMAILANIVTIVQQGSMIVSQVSLLNKIQYKVCLTREYNGIPIKEKGHIFDPIGKRICVLQKSSLLLLRGRA